MVLTAALVLTGLSAWAVALVQPWTGRVGEPGMVALPAAHVDPERVRAATQEVEQLCMEWSVPAAHPFERNPFVVGQRENGEDAVSPPEGAETERAMSQGRTYPEPLAPSPKELLSALKALRLEVTLVASDGSRWAVISGRDYRVGDTVAGMEIVEIQEGKVKLQRGNATCMLQMD